MKLTPVEQRLVDCVVAGDGLNLELDLSDSQIDDNIMGLWGKGRVVRATAIREILLGRLFGNREPDPRGLRLRGARIVGRINLDRTRIAIPLDLSFCNLSDGLSAHCSTMPALGLHGCIVNAQENGTQRDALRLTGATISGELDIRGAKLIAKDGVALFADRIHVEGGAVFDQGFTAVGRAAAVRLPGAEISGQLSLRGAKLIAKDGVALFADRIHVEGGAAFDRCFMAESQGHAVSLIGAHISGRFNVNEKSVQNAVFGKGKWDVDGLIYTGYPSCGPETWLELPRSGTPSFSPQPFQQLAAQARSMGHDRKARKVLIVQRNTELERAEMSRIDKVWARLTQLTVGFGYMPWLAFVWLLILLGAAWLLAVVLPDALANANGFGCSGSELFQVATKTTIPIFSPAFDVDCSATNTPTGQAVRVIGLLMTTLGWGLAALFGAGLTGIIRRS